MRGFRIELGEIESALIEHPLVRDAVVLAKEAASGARRLVGYVVPCGDTLTVGGLRSFAKAKLPDYMIPSSFVLLESLPTTPAGKVDRRALPEPMQAATDADEYARIIQSPVEGQLAKNMGGRSQARLRRHEG